MDEPEKIKVKSINPLSLTGRFDKIAFGLILFTIFLAPIFFIPSVGAPFQLTKTLLILGLTAVASVFFIVARLKEGSITIPALPVFVSVALLLVAQFLAAIFSANPASSLLGQGFDLFTFGTLLFLFGLMFLVSNLFRTKERIFYTFIALLGSFALVFIFQVARFFVPSFLSFGGLFTDASSNLLGPWNDLGIFFGLSVLLSLLLSELLTLSRLLRLVVYCGMCLSLLFLMVVNFSAVWWAIGVVSLVLFVYLASIKQGKVVPNLSGSDGDSVPAPMIRRKVSYLSLVVLIVSAVFIVDRYLPGVPVSSAVTKVVNVAQIDVRPSWSSTFAISRQTLAKDPVFGVGPNLFATEWLLHKPTVVNNTIFWNTNFNSGVGFVPSSLVTSGIAGFAAWLLFLIAFLAMGFRALFLSTPEPFSRFIVIASFFCSVFLWLFCVVYNPGIVLMTLTFVFSGLFLASLSEIKGFRSNDFTLSFAGNPRKGFFLVLTLIFLMIGSVTLGVVLADKYVSFVYFQKAVNTYNLKGDVVLSDAYLKKAVAMNDVDVFSRFLSQLSLIKINNLLEKAKDMQADKARADFQALLGDALRYAKKAVDENPTDYQNWLAYGGVYDAIVPLKISGAYENALTNYKEALARNPESPAIYLLMSRLELSNGNNAGAKDYIAKALAKKGDYTDAIFLLSQIEINEGNLTAATEAVEKVSSLAPNDPTVFFQLGLLRYNQKAYQKAIDALDRAVVLVPNYSNAKYFLGLSYSALGRTSDAIKQFNDIKALNPENEEVQLILTNLKAGRQPFTNAKPPIDSKPEKRATPPLEDNTSTGTEGLTE